VSGRESGQARCNALRIEPGGIHYAARLNAHALFAAHLELDSPGR